MQRDAFSMPNLVRLSTLSDAKGDGRAEPAMLQSLPIWLGS
jgi:hypothetical protein